MGGLGWKEVWKGDVVLTGGSSDWEPGACQPISRALGMRRLVPHGLVTRDLLTQGGCLLTGPWGQGPW